jgi:hypothetical protein
VIYSKNKFANGLVEIGIIRFIISYFLPKSSEKWNREIENLGFL